MPRIDDMVNELVKYYVFFTYDLQSAYHQVKVIESEHKFTAFEANGKLYEFTRIPFGVKNGVAAFQRVISEFVEKEELKDIFPYPDSVTVAGRTQKKHDANIKSFLEAIRCNNFTLNEFKTISSVDSIKILVYLIKNGRIKPDPDRLRPPRNFPPPTNLKQLKVFWGCLPTMQNGLIILQIKFGL